MKQHAHIVTLCAFISAPVLIAAHPQQSPMDIVMCGGQIASPPLRLPLEPLPMSPNHCGKACHAGCLRKRKTDAPPDTD